MDQNTIILSAAALTGAVGFTGIMLYIAGLIVGEVIHQYRDAHR